MLVTRGLQIANVFRGEGEFIPPVGLRGHLGKEGWHSTCKLLKGGVGLGEKKGVHLCEADNSKLGLGRGGGKTWSAVPHHGREVRVKGGGNLFATPEVISQVSAGNTPNGFSSA